MKSKRACSNRQSAVDDDTVFKNYNSIFPIHFFTNRKVSFSLAPIKFYNSERDLKPSHIL